ncbi:peptidylprolyl isomerase [Candidatus Pantoea edessiphila]|uniref:Periplasmic chaperone PpiD n=1 Tax=Candidatus Pantoea edessiphila TaxID=2044610 RepID=A0A2P5SXG2_9GAMM|nr:peptidylprolyl isomerase [Candidatus Pantoea edessiphila]MBK4775804.1 peptidylprolyl isomerase [Pantoea sp. Edef]PPI87014.1 peptidylprolyl isomerase [Candidatus Pantoea edessiphila]
MTSSFHNLYNSLLIKVILSISILLFIITSIGTYVISNRRNDYIAKVNGQKITNTELDQAVQDAINDQQKYLGDDSQNLLNNEFYINQVRQQALVYLIDKLLLHNYVNNLKFHVGDDQLKQVILNQKYFQVKGVFDNNQYRNVIKKIGLTTNQYVELLRRELLIQQLVGTIVNSDFILPNEIYRLSDLIAQKRSIRQATINVNALAKKQHTTNDEIDQYYQRYKNTFLIPEKFRISYIKLSANKLSANKLKKSVSKSDISQWYDDHKNEYYIQSRNHYRIIQTNTSADAKKVLDKFNKGIPFSSLAKTMSTDPISARKGGDIGWIDMTNIPDEIKDSGLKKKGEISKIINTGRMFLIVYLEDVIPGRIKSLSEVHDTIVDQINKKNIIDFFSKFNQKVSSLALNNNSLKDVELVTGVKKVKTNWFNLNNIPKEINSSGFREALYSKALNIGMNSDVIKIDDYNAIVIHIDDHKKETVKTIEQVKLQIVNMLKKDKAHQQAKFQASKLLNSPNKQKALAAAGITLGNNKIISRGDIRDPINRTAFSLPEPNKGESSWGITEDINGNIVLIMLNKIIPNHMPEDKLNELVVLINKSNSQLILKMLLNNLSKKAVIKYNHINNQV